MKTLEELYQEVMTNEEVKKEFCKLRPGDLENFCKKHGCDVSLGEARRFVAMKYEENTDKDFTQRAGGKGVNTKEALVSAFTAGIGCVALVIGSLGNDKLKVGTAIKGKAMLCGDENGSDLDHIMD